MNTNVKSNVVNNIMLQMSYYLDKEHLFLLQKSCRKRAGFCEHGRDYHASGDGGTTST